jgi:hypothetical protein
MEVTGTPSTGRRHYEAQLHSKQSQNKVHNINELNSYPEQNQRIFPKRIEFEANQHLKIGNSRQTKHRRTHRSRFTNQSDTTLQGQVRRPSETIKGDISLIP